MRFKAKTSPVIRATLDALEAINRLQEARLVAATDDAERTDPGQASRVPACPGDDAP